MIRPFGLDQFENPLRLLGVAEFVVTEAGGEQKVLHEVRVLWITLMESVEQVQGDLVLTHQRRA